MKNIYPRPFENDDKESLKKRLETRSKDSAEMLSYWNKTAALIGGLEKVREQPKIFLPQFPREAQEQWDFRISVSKLTNIYHDNLETLSAKPFEEEIKLVEGENKTIPDAITDFIEDVDGRGNNITVFSSESFFNAINSTHHWILVDFPTLEPGVTRTLAQDKEMGIKPFWSQVLAENVFEVKTESVNGSERLKYVRIFEPEANDHGQRFTEYEILDGAKTPSLTVYEKDKDGFYSIIKQITLTIDQIPLVPIITGRRDGERWLFKPPLRDAVELQITLFQQESNLEHAKVMTAFPMLSANGVKPMLGPDKKPLPLNLGPSTVLYAPIDGAGNVGSWAYVEPSASSLTFLQNDIKATKDDLRELGKQPLTAQSGNLTVITTAYAAGKSRSAVGAWGLMLKDALENALVLTAKWLKISKEQYDPQVSVYDGYDDFSDEIADVTALSTARAAKDISQETYWEELKRRGILSAEFDAETEAERLLNELPGDDDMPDDDADKDSLNPQE